MRKIFFILLIVLFSYSFGFEDVPIYPQDANINIRYLETQSDLINTDGMKKSAGVNKAKNEVLQNEKPRYKFDQRQIYHQRALDYTTRQSNTMMLPRF